MASDEPPPAAIAVADGRIVALGGEREVDAWCGPETVVVELDGKVLAPSFVDHHVHLLNLGISLEYAVLRPESFIDIAASPTRQDLAAAISAAARAQPPGSWIVGKGWSQGAWGEVELPDHRLLTDSAPGHPVYLTRVDGHAGWTNEMGLRLAGIDAGTPDPPGGAVRRFADGTPTGVLLERANELLLPLVPQPSDEEVRRAFRRAAEALAAQGVTEVYDAGFLAVPGVVDLNLDLDRYLELLLSVDRESPLPLVVHLMIPAPSPLADRICSEPDAARRLSPRVDVTHLKLWADGAMGSRGAHLSHPYHDDPGTRGVPRMTREEIRREALRAIDAGLDVAGHAIGDEAVAAVLDVYESLLAERPGLEPTRLRLEHFSYAREADFARAADLGVLLSIQPNFVVPGDDGVAMEDSRVGLANSERVYAWRRLSSLGARMAFGSDYFTAPLPPLTTFYCAVTRRNLAGNPDDGWHPGQRLGRTEGMELLTRLWPPGGGSSAKGALVTGAPADLVILTADPLTAEPSDLLGISVVATYLAGEQVAARD
jgi:predicted amidohydrolase YtcJ